MANKLNQLGSKLENLDVEKIKEKKASSKGTAEESIPSVLEERNNLASRIAEGRFRSTNQELVQPEQCRMWRRHNRLYDLLSSENCAELIDDIRGKGTQHTPAIARRLINDPDGFEFEIIAGSRRHFAVNYLRQTEKLTKIFYLIEVRELDDSDAFLISDAENRGRKDISDYERALDYLSALNEFYDGNTNVMSKNIGMPRTSLHYYLKLAQLPDSIVKAFAEPTHIALRNAPKLLAAVEDAARRDGVLSKAAELFQVQEQSKALGNVYALDGPKVVKALLESEGVNQTKAEKRNLTGMTKTENGKVLFDYERGRKYMTVKIPLEQMSNLAEVTKRMKSEFGKLK